MSSPDGLDEAYADFEQAVTMTPQQLKNWGHDPMS